MKQLLTLLLLIITFISARAGAAGDENKIMNSLDSTPGVTVIQPTLLKQRLGRQQITEPAGDANAQSIDNKGQITDNHGQSTGNRNEKSDNRIQKNKDEVYRVEIFADNSREAKTQATARRRSVQNRFPQYVSMIVFESPFWRVRVGEFHSKADAEAAMKNIRRAFPSYSSYLRVVRR